MLFNNTDAIMDKIFKAYKEIIFDKSKINVYLN